jgi:uncharacterized membrane protein
MTSASTSPDRTCQLCGRDGAAKLLRGIQVGPAVAELIRIETGGWSEEGWICESDLSKFRHKYLESLLADEKGELSALEREVLESLKEQEILSRNPDEELQSALTFGQRLSDRISAFGGSWKFILSFASVLVLWVVVNSVVLAARPFDPYPYIFLNLILSTLAAIQAPVIMMSQIRQEARDRLHVRNDYQVNLKAELEIRHLHQKVDHLLSHQWERMVKIQEMQLELINEVRGRK